jgi:hypothetical protein
VNEGFQISASSADCRVLFFKFRGEFFASAGIDGHFETGNALQTPLDIGKRLDQFAFAQADRLKFRFISGDVLAVGFGVVGRQQYGAAGEPGFHSIHRGNGPSYGPTGAGGKLGIGTIRGDGGFGSGDSDFTSGRCS